MDLLKSAPLPSPHRATLQINKENQRGSVLLKVFTNHNKSLSLPLCLANLTFATRTILIRAMAEALVGLLLTNLSSFSQREFGLIWGVDEDIDKLSSLLLTIKAVIQDAEKREFDDKAIADWLTKLKDTAYDADDVLDEWLTYIRDSTCALSCLSPEHINLRHRIAKKAKKIKTRLDEISEEKSKLHLHPGVMQTGLQFLESRETGATLTEDVVYGRDVDKENIINVLLHGKNLSILPIVGMGGLGKTTLTQFVYKDKRVVEHFDIKIWICVSEDFEVKRLIKMMLESLTEQACDLKHLDALQKQLQGKLSGKRFLLVLDDVWNEDLEKWQTLKSLLTCGATGSSILVTTRLETVASIVGTMSPHHLTILSLEDCWYLFKGRAFGLGNEKERADLVEIGKQIVKKCSGVPLAAKSLGGLLFSTREVKDWLQVKDNDIWKLPQADENGILPSLRLSYKYLPSSIKQCFAFCSIYPKDYVMKKKELIRLWMANGFVQSHGTMELEDVGNQVFTELLRRSFFQDTETNEFGDIQTCKIHDPMHDLACLVSAKECCVVEVGKEDKLHKGIRHGSILLIDSVATNLLLTVAELSNRMLRTLLVVRCPNADYFDCGQMNLKKLDCLRALDLSSSKTKSVPTTIGRMKHLRYLNLSRTPIKFLPESICNLRNLQSLILTDCWWLKKLPKHMRKMSSLRHLEIVHCRELAEMPIGMGQLSHIQTLSLFVVGIEKGRHITELKGLNHLGGEIEIKGLEHVRNVEEAKEANLLTKQTITSLALSWETSDVVSSSGGGVAADAELQEKVLEEGLKPHQNLKALEICGFKGVVLPSWMGELQNLVRVKLEECKSCVYLPPLGKLPRLKVLIIQEMDSIKCMGDDFYGEGERGGSATTTCLFPSLHQLEIHQMLNLEEWALPASSSSEENHGRVFPCLKELTIWGCPKLKAIPCLPCVQNIKLGDCNEMILRSIPSLPPRSLLFLEIGSFYEMTHLPEGTFINSSTAALQSLQIGHCHKLNSLIGEIQNLTSLTSLEIANCWELDSLSELEGLLGKLTSLAQLTIKFCPRLKCLPVMGIQGFNNSLKELEIWNCYKLASVSEGLQYLTSLQILNIQWCPNLKLMSRDDQEEDDQEEDGFQHLISLQSLTLRNLPKLRALPEGMQHLTMLKSLTIWACKNLCMLPEWLKHLTSLQYFGILYCHPDLHKRCEKDKGDDWHLISHIPDIRIW